MRAPARGDRNIVTHPGPRTNRGNKQMSREIYLNVSEGFVVAQCLQEEVGVSTIESLACGGTRLVCMSVRGAETMRRKLKKNLMKGDVTRERHGPGWGFIART